MGGVAEWKERAAPPQGEPPPKGSNASLSAMLASVKRRAGRAAQPNPQPPMNAPREAAIKQLACGAARKRGRSPKPEFPALKRAVLRDRVRRMVASWRRKRFTSRGNERLAPQEVALAQARARERVGQIVRHTLTARSPRMQRNQVTQWICDHTVCQKCGGKLAYVKQLSRQALSPQPAAHISACHTHTNRAAWQPTSTPTVPGSGGSVRVLVVYVHGRLQHARPRDIWRLAAG